jgi:hypothetical protein
MTKVAKTNQAEKNTHTTIIVNETIYDFELRGTIPSNFLPLSVPNKSSCVVPIMKNTNETNYKIVRMGQKGQRRRQESYSRQEFINYQRIIIRWDEKTRYVDVVIWIKVIWIWICIAYNLLLTLQLSLNIFNGHMGFTCAHVAKLIDMNCLEMVYKAVRCESDANQPKFLQLYRYN